MATVVVLGSSFAVPDEEHENTHLVLVGANGLVMVDCAGQPVLRLKKAGLDFHQISDLVLTHFHPDHVYGVPMLLMEMWLRGRQTPLRVHGLRHCMDRMELVMNAYEWHDWPRMFPVTFHPIDATKPNTFLMENTDFSISATPVRHFLPTIGLRITDKHTQRILAYSCDTEPCEEVVHLAVGADVLFHEATGAGLGHASAAQAGELAKQAGVKHLVLIHYRTGGADTSLLAPEAEKTFGGPVTLAEDFMRFNW